MSDFKFYLINWNENNGGAVVFTNAPAVAFNSFIKAYSSIIVLSDETITSFLSNMGYFNKVVLSTNNDFDNEFFTEIYELLTISENITL